MKSFNLFSQFLMLSVSLLMFSCTPEDSNDVNQDRIYTDYEVFYNSNTDKTWVVAKFKFGNAVGTILDLKDDAFVTFNGDTLPYNIFFGGHQKEYAGRITTGSFSYTNTEGTVFVNSIPAVDTIAFPNDLDTLDKSSAYTISWGGSALAADEKVAIFIGTNWTWGDDALLYQELDGATDIVIGLTQLANLSVGPATCYMDRSKEVALNQGTSAGGAIRQKFRARNVNIQVVE